MQIGFHTSIAGGLYNAPIRAKDLGCETFQMYTRSPRVWKTNALKPKDIEKFKQTREELNFRNCVIHMPYLPNLANVSDPKGIQRTRQVAHEEVERADQLKVDFLIFHMGSHKGKGKEKGLKSIVSHLEHLIAQEPLVKLTLENSAGSKNSVGESFEDLEYVINHVSDASKLAICLDTCHTHAAGYNLSGGHVDDTLDLIETEVGLKYISVIHLNDIRGSLGSNKDRHEHIGMGDIGSQGFRELLNTNKLPIESIPIILETPQDDTRKDKDNLNAVRTLLEQN